MIRKEMPARICLWRDIRSNRAFPDDMVIAEVEAGLLLPEGVLEADYVRKDIAESEVPDIKAGCFVDVTGLSDAAYMAVIAGLFAAGCDMATIRERPCGMKKGRFTYLVWVEAPSGSGIIDVVFRNEAMTNAICASDLIKALPQLIEDEAKNG